MTGKVTVICENTVMTRGLLGEHGLAMLLEVKEKRFLLDTGAGMALIHNSRALNIDLGKLDGIILSHGHYDHTGGLKALLQETGPLNIYAHPHVFREKYKYLQAKEDLEYIGIPAKKEELERLGASVCLSSNPVQLAQGMMLSGEITRVDPKEGYEKSFRIKDGNNYLHDIVPDDQAVVVESPHGDILILGCAHAGPVNTIKHFQKENPGLRIRAVVGGMHLYSREEKAIKKTVTTLKKLGVEYVFPCHCTGNKAEMEFSRVFANRCHKIIVGSNLDLDEIWK